MNSRRVSHGVRGLAAGIKKVAAKGGLELLHLASGDQRILSIAPVELTPHATHGRGNYVAF